FVTACGVVITFAVTVVHVSVNGLYLKILEPFLVK
ncbi:hypothetical protein LCGC14_2552010, partial [marine sediment metagenome]